MTETRHDTSAASEALKRMRAQQPGAGQESDVEERTTPTTPAGSAYPRAQALPPRPTRMPTVGSPLSATPAAGTAAPTDSAATAARTAASATMTSGPAGTETPPAASPSRNAAGTEAPPAATPSRNAAGTEAPPAATPSRNAAGTEARSTPTPSQTSAAAPPAAALPDAVRATEQGHAAEAPTTAGESASAQRPEMAQARGSASVPPAASRALAEGTRIPIAGRATDDTSAAAPDTAPARPSTTTQAASGVPSPTAPHVERSQRDAAARHMAALPPLRADVEHDAPKKLNDWLDHLSAPDWKAIGSRVKGRAEAARLRRQERAGQRERRRIEQARDPQAHQAPDGAEPPAVDALNTASTDERPPQESSAAPRAAAEAPAAGSPAAGTAGPSPAARREPADTQPAGAAQQPAADLDLAALVESARAAIHARVTAAHIHPYTMLSVDAGPAIGLSGEASTPALLASPDDGGNGPSTNDGGGGSAGTDGATNGGGGNGVVPPGNRIRGRGSTGAGNAGRVDAASDDASGPGFAAVARSIVTGVTSPRPTDEELRDASPFWVDDDEPLYVPPYNLPSRTPDPPENRQDRLRRAVVAGVAVVALLLGFLGLGLFGGGTAHSDPGSPFLPRAALLSPGVDSFMIWGLLFCWVVLFAVYQWHPTQRSSPRQRDLGYPTAGAALLGALWLLAARAEMAATAMWIAIVLTGVLVYCLRLMNQRTARDNAERICVDAPTALFLGWMLTVLPMSVGVYLTSRGADFLLPGSGWAVLAIIGATWAAASFSMSERGRIVLALGFGWGLFWIMLVRLLGPLFSTPVAIVAGLCAFIVLLATENRRYQIGHAERRAARGQRTEF